MAAFRLNLLESLARQLAFAPLEVRMAQLQAAESLIGDLDLTRSYPADFVVFRVTGYHPARAAVADEQLTGLALQHDLGQLIERVSETLDLVAAAQPEPVLSIDDVTERFNVTSKTIQRWRKKGLVSRRFIFPDGKRRVGFLLSSIERFIGRHSDAVRDANANPTLVGDGEVGAIVAAARRQIACHALAESELTRRLARRFRRSALTILHTLRKHDQAHPEQAVLTQASRAMRTGRRHRIIAAARRGVSIARIARRFRRSRAAIYRVVLDDRIDRLTRRTVRFHDDELYHTRDAADAIAAIVRSSDAAAAAHPSEDVRVPRGLPPYLADLYRTPLLTPAQERALFLAFHYHKYRFVAERRRFDPEIARHREVARLEACRRDAIAFKNRIVNANLRLVVSVAKKHVRPAAIGGAAAGPTLMELVSEGNLILMRAVESFDVHKNVRFSTYATFALMKGFARLVPELKAQATTGRSIFAYELPDPQALSDRDRHADREEIRQMLCRLDRDERTVVAAYYGVDAAAPDAGRHAQTFEEIGRRLGLSKHRVRQIERSALAKLRRAMGVEPKPVAG